MSDTTLASPVLASRNPAGLQLRSPVARALHRSRTVVKLALGAALLLVATQACVIPPSLSVGAEDAAMNSPPAITSVRFEGQEFTSPDSLLFRVGESGNMTLGVYDTDVGDTLYVRMFVDYEPLHLAARSLCEAPPSTTDPTAARTTNTCNVGALCNPSDVSSATSLTSHDLNVVVFDRPPLDDGTAPPFQAMQAGGLSTQQYFHLNCEAAPTN